MRVWPVRVELTGEEFFELATRAEAAHMRMADYLKQLAFAGPVTDTSIVHKPSAEEVHDSVRVLHELGWSMSEISKRVGVQRATVKNIITQIEGVAA